MERVNAESASSQNYCRTPLNSVTPNTTYILNYTCKNVSGTSYQMILDFPSATSTSNMNIGANPGPVNVTAGGAVWTNANKTLTYTFTAVAPVPNVDGTVQG